MRIHLLSDLSSLVLLMKGAMRSHLGWPEYKVKGRNEKEALFCFDKHISLCMLKCPWQRVVF
jgi:hypothetical protein